MVDDEYNGMHIPKGATVIANARYVYFFVTYPQTYTDCDVGVSPGMKPSSNNRDSSARNASYRNLKVMEKLSLLAQFTAGAAGTWHRCQVPRTLLELNRLST